MLKIIGGTARGRQLKTLPKEDASIRPMLGMMKKSVFDIITPRLQGSLFLDLYAGVGSVGIEALSRGAERVVFAEISDKSISLVKYNLEMLGFADNADIIKCDVIKGFPKFQNKYDIIFLGPPYKDGAKNALALTYPTLKNIVLYSMLKDDGVVISQRHMKEPVGTVAGLSNFRTEKYGDTVICFYRMEK
ncbi:MAG: 16S rRNA (guanine(966)-N(2))-methyltransferase RsmD [Endomicrobiaceae bacterium]|nr:16S rRNA (guanine(966)-N(2))-methyltransferase RsmD [Endomicrobiaceae bacterium]